MVGSGCTPNSVVVGFFNSDKIPDLAVASGGCGDAVSILLDNGDGPSAPPGRTGQPRRSSQPARHRRLQRR
jgi:hypothetical protein